MSTETVLGEDGLCELHYAIEIEGDLNGKERFINLLSGYSETGGVPENWEHEQSWRIRGVDETEDAYNIDESITEISLTVGRGNNAQAEKLEADLRQAMIRSGIEIAAQTIGSEGGGIKNFVSAHMNKMADYENPVLLKFLPTGAHYIDLEKKSFTRHEEGGKTTKYEMVFIAHSMNKRRNALPSYELLVTVYPYKYEGEGDAKEFKRAYKLMLEHKSLGIHEI